MQLRWLIPIGAGAASVAQIAHATQYMTVEQAQHAAFPDATAFIVTPVAVDTTAFGAPVGWSPRLWQARNGDKLLGWLFEDAVIGKSELITYALAIEATGAVISVEVLDYRESHGGEIRLAPWRKQFVGKTAHDPMEFNRDIKNISGATLSCRHLTEGVQRLLKVHARVLAPTAKG
jgi:Na+-translocating ferredoxin:NAD+ oxidoreductase RnfG subunit